MPKPKQKKLSEEVKKKTVAKKKTAPKKKTVKPKKLTFSSKNLVLLKDLGSTPTKEEVKKIFGGNVFKKEKKINFFKKIIYAIQKYLEIGTT